MSELKLRLFVLGSSAKTQAALSNLKRILDVAAPGEYSLEVVDIRDNPELAEQQRILATPALIKLEPGPVHRIIGDMSDTAKVLLGLGLGPSRALNQRGVE